LVTNWSPVGLANLRSKMAVTIIEREQMDPEAEAEAYRTAAVLDAEEEQEEAAPADEAEPESDEDALAAAYAAMANFAPATVEIQPELGSASAARRGPSPPPARARHRSSCANCRVELGAPGRAIPERRGAHRVRRRGQAPSVVVPDPRAPGALGFRPPRRDDMTTRTTPPFRADHVGSFLRPPYLLDARSKKAAGEISAAQLREVEDRAITRSSGSSATAG